MKVKICYDEDAEQVDIIDVPIMSINDLEKLQCEFFKWLFDKSNNHKYWVYNAEGHKSYCAYDVDAFVCWINQYLTNNNNCECAVCIAKNVSGIQYDYPILYF